MDNIVKGIAATIVDGKLVIVSDRSTLEPLYPVCKNILSMHLTEKAHEARMISVRPRHTPKRRKRRK